jgi:hypothetical protein
MPEIHKSLTSFEKFNTGLPFYVVYRRRTYSTKKYNLYKQRHVETNSSKAKRTNRRSTLF